jgi:hypothetical protein
MDLILDLCMAAAAVSPTMQPALETALEVFGAVAAVAAGQPLRPTLEPAELHRMVGMAALEAAPLRLLALNPAVVAAEVLA